MCWSLLLVSVACAPSMIEQRDLVDATVVELTQETFDGRSAATGFIVGKVPGAFLWVLFAPNLAIDDGGASDQSGGA